MNKALILTGVGTGGTVISVGGAYISGAFDGSNTKENNNIRPLNLKLPDNLDAFKQKGGGDELVQDHFKNIDGSNQGQELNSSSSLNLPNASLGGAGVSNTSKLVVNWEKYGCSDGSSDKGSGKIQGLWSIVTGNNGIIFYAAAKSSTAEDGKLDVEGIVYVTVKNAGENGKITHNKTSGITSPITEGKDHLPNPGDKFMKGSVKNYGGFVDNDQLIGSCKSRSSEPTPKSKFMGSWTWSHNDSNPGGNDIDDRKILVGNRNCITGLEKFYGQSEMSQFKSLLDIWIGPGSEGNFENKSLGVNTN